MNGNDKDFNFQENSKVFFQEKSDKKFVQANNNPSQPLANNNSILDRFFMDTHGTTNNQEKIQNNYNTDDLLNKLFNDTLQSKSKNITKPNWFEDSIINTKPNNKPQENDIFGYLDEQSLFEDNHSIRPSLQNKDPIKVNDKSSNDIFNEPIKSSNKMDINVDLDKMLMELNKNLESNANNLKNFNDNLNENIQKQDNIMNSSFNLLIYENNKEIKNNVSYTNKDNNVNQVYDLTKSPSLLKENDFKYKDTKNVPSNLINDVIKTNYLRTDSIGNNSFNVLNKSNNINVMDNSIKLREDTNKSQLGKIERNMMKEENNKLNLTKLSKNENFLKDEFDNSKVSKASKKEIIVKEELDKSNISKISKNDKISNKITNNKNEFVYNLPDVSIRKENERNEIQQNSFFSQNKGNDFIDDKQESFLNQKNNNKLLDNEIEYFFSERQPQRGNKILEENNLNVFPIDAISQRNNTVSSKANAPIEPVKINNLDFNLNNQSRQQSVQRLNYTSVNQSQIKLNDNDIHNHTLNDNKNFKNDNVIKINKEKIILTNGNLDESRRQDTRLSKILDNSVRESHNIMKTNRENAFPVVNYFEPSKDMEINNKDNEVVVNEVVKKENLIFSESAYKNEEDELKLYQSKKDEEAFNIENYDLKSYKEEIHEDVPEIREEVLEKPEEQRFLPSNVQISNNNYNNNIEPNIESINNEYIKKEIVISEKINEEKPQIDIVKNINKIESKNSINNNSNRFSFFNQFQEQSNSNSNRKRGDNNYFEDINLSGNDITNKINADQAIFEGIDNNLSSRNNRQSNNPLNKEESNNNFTNTAKYVGIETNDLVMSIGRQSHKKFLSSSGKNVNEQNFTPFIPKDEEVVENQLQSIEDVHEEFPMEQIKEKGSDNNFQFSDNHYFDEKDGIFNKNDENFKKNSYFSAFPDEKNFVSNIKSDSNNKNALNEKNSHKDIDFDAIYINFQQEGKEVEKPVTDKAERYREKEPETVAVVPQTSHQKSNFEEKDVSETEVLVAPEKPKKEKVTSSNEKKEEKKEVIEKEKTVIEKPENKKETENGTIPTKKKENVIYLNNDLGEKYYGKIVVGKDDEKNLKFKKDLIFTDTFFTILNNRKVQIKFNDMPPYFDQPEEIISVEIKKLLESLSKGN